MFTSGFAIDRIGVVFILKNFIFRNELDFIFFYFYSVLFISPHHQVHAILSLEGRAPPTSTTFETRSIITNVDPADQKSIRIIFYFEIIWTMCVQAMFD
jgi:hypothetical protein